MSRSPSVNHVSRAEPLGLAERARTSRRGRPSRGPRREARRACRARCRGRARRGARGTRGRRRRSRSPSRLAGPAARASACTRRDPPSPPQRTATRSDTYAHRVVLAIVPVNSPSSAKRRLGPLLSRRAAGESRRAMLADVVDACKAGASRSTRCSSSRPNRRSPRPDVDVLVDPGTGHAAADRAGARRSSRRSRRARRDGRLPARPPGDARPARRRAARRSRSARPRTAARTRSRCGPPTRSSRRSASPDGAAVTVERARASGLRGRRRRRPARRARRRPPGRPRAGARARARNAHARVSRPGARAYRQNSRARAR